MSHCTQGPGLIKSRIEEYFSTTVLIELTQDGNTVWVCLRIFLFCSIHSKTKISQSQLIFRRLSSIFYFI